jgi:hypothetical protein
LWCARLSRPRESCTVTQRLGHTFGFQGFLFKWGLYRRETGVMNCLVDRLRGSSTAVTRLGPAAMDLQPRSQVALGVGTLFSPFTHTRRYCVRVTGKRLYFGSALIFISCFHFFVIVFISMSLCLGGHGLSWWVGIEFVGDGPSPMTRLFLLFGGVRVGWGGA